MSETILLALLIFLAALLYSSVGHAGASGYLAAMALFGLAPDVMKPTALVLNLLVATVGTIRYASAGHFSWKLFWPFAALAVPCAYLGGRMQLPVTTYKLLLGLALLFAAWRLAFALKSERSCSDTATSGPNAGNPIHSSSVLIALPLGAALGFISGLIAVGGGIFLSPLLLLMRWADVRKTAGVSVVFILVNSASGLLGQFSSVQIIPHEIIWWSPAALIGGLIGSELGSRRLPPIAMRRLLAAALVVAGGKLLLGK